ncbi:MAG: hypothetical protein ACREOC_08285 [Gemmatimonadales bacterium]
MIYRTLGLAMFALVAFTVSGEAQSKKVKKDRKVVTAEEVSEANVNTAYEAVQKLRSDWLRQGQRQMTVYGRTGRAGETSVQDAAGTLNESSPVKLAVFVDGTELGGPEELHRIPSNRIEEMRFLSGSDAQQQYGSRYGGGLIQIKLKT